MLLKLATGKAARLSLVASCGHTDHHCTACMALRSEKIDPHFFSGAGQSQNKHGEILVFGLMPPLACSQVSSGLKAERIQLLRFICMPVTKTYQRASVSKTSKPGGNVPLLALLGQAKSLNAQVYGKD